ncbi:ADP-ribosylglycohydrolase family protein [Actinacidiphila glaucinigra]|uniref:ADP-ribosylglycohydrolase family protein n=1 Tax=Actinacidiphila glaucinigra TaxID=235986 RepID=UPI0033A4854F
MTRTPGFRLDAQTIDRAAGVLLGAAVGDALGVPYEFAATLREDQRPGMVGGGLGPYRPGEYSDDTQMQVCVAQVAATGADLRGPEALDAIAAGFRRWLDGGAGDVGAQTRTVLGAAGRLPGSPAEALREAARRYAAGHRLTAGNGSLMRTGIVALAHLGDPAAMAEAATAVSALTHPDPECADACVLWCSGIRTAVLHGTFGGVRAGLELLPAGRRDLWAKRLDEAEAEPPRHFAGNGWVVQALQAAWSAITRTAVPGLDPAQGHFPALHLRLALEAAVRAGHDTDTVAAIAGALLGARWGCSGVPLDWQRAVHGWPGLTAPDLVRLAVRTAREGAGDENAAAPAPHMPLPSGSPGGLAAPHPHDPGVLLGVPGTEPVPVGAVVSLCRPGTPPDLPGADVEHIQVWLPDGPGGDADLPYALDQAARQVLRLRRADRRVLLHSADGPTRAHAVAAVYSHLIGRVPDGPLPVPCDRELRDAVRLLTAAPAPDSPYDAHSPATPVPAARDTAPQEDVADDGGAEEQPELDRERPRLRDDALPRVRGLLLGLALGDTLGTAREALPARGPLPAGTATRSACLTVEDIIRAAGELPSAVRNTQGRRAALPGDEAPEPYGLLNRVPAPAEARGSEGVLLAAALPAAVAGAVHGPARAAVRAREIAAHSAAADAAVLLHHCLTGAEDIQEPLFAEQSQVRIALRAGLDALGDSGRTGHLHTAFRQAADDPADPRRLAALAPDATAPSALRGALYCAASLPHRHQVDEALRLAATAPDGASVAGVTGALLGAAHGARALPAGLAGRHELAPVLDALAHDLVAAYG